MTTYRDTTLVGLPEQVANVLRNHQTAGTLVAMTAPRPVSATDPRVRVGVRLVDTTTPAARPVRVTSPRTHTTNRVQHTRRRIRRRIAIAATVTGAAVALVAVVAYLVGQLVAFLVDHAALIAGLLAIAALILTALRGATSSRRHCPGC